MGTSKMRILYVIFVQLLFKNWIFAQDVSIPGLYFSKEPPNELAFSNTTGLKVECLAEGITPVNITWSLVDGSPVTNIPSLREVTPSGELMFYPFGAEKFRPDIHAAVYRCNAVNTVGMIRSKDVNIHGVVMQNYEPQVYDVYAIEGNTAVLKCHIPAMLSDYIKVIAWIKNDKLLNQHGTGEANDKYSMMVSGELHITDVNIGDSGTNYKCKTQHILTGETKISTVPGKLFVTESQGNVKPRIIKSMSILEETVGSTAVLSCVAQGNPPPKIMWMQKNRNGQLVQVTYGGNFLLSKGSLLINNVATSDAGNYVCEASNKNGQDVHEMTLVVIEALLLKITPSVVTSKVHDSVTLKCDSGTQSVHSFDWFHNGVQLKQETGNVLIISSVQVTDQGMYQCMTKNGYDMAQASAELKLSEIAPYLVETFKEVNHNPNESASVKCVATGIPLPTFSWSLDDSLIINSSRLIVSSSVDNNGRAVSILKISKLAIEDGGVYSCKAVNDGGESLHHARINVFGKLGARNRVIKFAVAGSNAFLNCPIYGYPIDEITWTKGSNKAILRNLRYKTFKNGTLWIQNVQRYSDGGIYHCEGQNSYNQKAASMVEVRVIVPPKLVPFEFQDELLREGMRARLQCVVSEGDLPLNVKWLKDGNPVSPELGVLITVIDEFSSILTINSITPSHNGKYTCEASNQAATVTYTAELSVNVLPKIIPFGFLDDQFYKGMRAHVTCAISEGDLPVTFEWFKDGKVIPNDLGIVTRKYDDRTESLSIDNVGSQHSGKFSCVVRNRAGMDTFTAPLLVRVAPKIIPFHFGGLHYEGSPTRVVCGLQEGDTPIKFSWLQNNVTLVARATISMHDVDGLSSILSIGSLSSNHSGVYTCIAENGAGVAHYEAVLQGDLPLTIKWEKDGLPIPPALGINVHKVDTYTSIMTIDRAERKHVGNYSCVAQNRAASASHTAMLVVNVPPKIVPFTFQDESLVEGLLARVSCIVSRGDLPLKLHWEKDGAAVTSGKLGIIIRSFDEHSSILSIADVSSKHNGHYTCVANNDAGSTRHSTQLTVKVPPKWILEPKDVSATVGETVELECQSDGYPKPTTEWFRLKDLTTLNTELTPIKTASDLYITDNGSLIISKISTEHTGYYVCRASNGIGIPLDATVQIKINAPPQFKQLLSNLKSSKEKNVQWLCEAKGEQPMSVYWYKDNKPLQTYDSRIGVQTVNQTSFISSTLTIHKIIRNDNGVYQCSANNTHGTTNMSSVLTVLETPEPPYEIKVASLSSTTVELIWNAGFNGNDAVKKYIIQYKEAPESWDKAITMEIVNGEPTNTIVAHLSPATNYMFRIFAENSQGRSQQSQSIHARTSDDVPTGAPENVQVEAIDMETFKITWKAPDQKVWNGKLLGFYVGYKTVDSEDSYLYKTLLTPEPNAGPYSIQISGLKQFTKFAVTVQAYNSQGKGPLSEPIIVMTSEGAPSVAPMDVRCTTLTSQSIHVTWTSPPLDSINGILSGYKIMFKPASDWFDDDMAENFNFSIITSATLTALEKFSNYSIQVLAMTKSGDGPKSNAIFCKTLDDVPSSPADIKVSPASIDSVIVSWKSPDSPNGIIKSYSVYWKEGKNSKQAAMVQTLPSPTTNYEVSRLNKGIDYEFWVTASTAAGEGTPSKTIKQSPTGPKVAAKVVSFSNKIIAAWKSSINLPCLAVGIPEPEKVWTNKGKPIEIDGRIKIGSDGALSVSNLEEMDAGDYACSIRNELSSDKITYTIIVLAPPPAPVADVVATTFNSIKIKWNMPVTKTAKVKGYSIQMKKRAGDRKDISVGPDTYTYELTNLDCGQKYEIAIAAFNRIGIGAFSEQLLTATNGTVPSPPSKNELIDETSHSVSLYLNTWKSNGCPILYYIVEYAPLSTSEWSLISSNVKPEQRRLVIPGLKSGTWHGLKMTAHNSAGSYVAEYTFATLSSTGATISPDMQSDAANEDVEGLFVYLNFYLIVPITCTMIVLVAILAAACFYVKVKKRTPQSNADNRMPVTGAEMKQGARSGSFSYMQRGTLNRAAEQLKLAEDDLTPYATFQLASHVLNTLGRNRQGTPPLPPPRFDGFSNSAMTTDSCFSRGESCTPGHGPVETTFIFPRLPEEGIHRDGHFPHHYPTEELNLRFN